MTVGEQQRLFTRLIASLIQYAYAQGYELTFGEAWRTPEMVAIYAQRGSGSKNSVHPDRLAVDFNLFKDGRFLTTTEDHAPLGAFWKSLHPLCRWGGDFPTRPDGNHYSMALGDRA